VFSGLPQVAAWDAILACTTPHAEMGGGAVGGKQPLGGQAGGAWEGDMRIAHV